MKNLNGLDYNYKINKKLIIKYLYLWILLIIRILLGKERSLNWEGKVEVWLLLEKFWCQLVVIVILRRNKLQEYQSHLESYENMIDCAYIIYIMK